MNEYKIIAVCLRCGGEDKWFMLSEKSDKESVINEALGHLDDVKKSGYKCNQCLGSKFGLKSVKFVAD